MTNQKHTPSINSQQDRLAYLWLALGILLFAFATPRWTIPLAAWLAPIFLLRFARTQPLLRGMLLLLLASALVLGFALQGVFPFSGVFYYLTVFGTALVSFLPPYLLDRVLARRLGGLLGTLVFPLAVTTVSYLNALVNPLGTAGNLAYTQYGNLPLLQLVSVTGIWGIVLVMSWLASVVNWAWERGFAWPLVRGGAVLYGSLLALVLLFGGARLALFPPQGSTVRVAGISPSHALVYAADKQLSQHWDALFSGMGTQAEREHARRAVAQAYAPINDELFSLSLQEARAGAKIIVWPECGVNVLQEDEAALLARASTLARTTGTYLDMGMCEILSHPVPSRFVYDEIILLDPSGSVVWRYQKAHPVPGADPFPPGDGLVPTAQTTYGRLSNVICFDDDFPGTIRQAGQAGADIMLVPSNDWREVDPYHTQTATFRAIENGFSLVIQSSRGLALTVDDEGHVLGASDYYTSDPQVMVVYVPMQGVRTIYATIGDLFAWLSLAGLVALIGVALARRPKAGKAVEAAPSGEPLPVS